MFFSFEGCARRKGRRARWGLVRGRVARDDDDDAVVVVEEEEEEEEEEEGEEEEEKACGGLVGW